MPSASTAAAVTELPRRSARRRGTANHGHAPRRLLDQRVGDDREHQGERDREHGRGDADAAVRRRPACGACEDQARPVPQVPRVRDPSEIAQRRGREEGAGAAAGAPCAADDHEHGAEDGQERRGSPGTRSSARSRPPQRRASAARRSRPPRRRPVGIRLRYEAPSAIAAPAANSQTRVVVSKYARAGCAAVSTTEYASEAPPTQATTIAHRSRTRPAADGPCGGASPRRAGGTARRGRTAPRRSATSSAAAGSALRRT